MSCYTHKMAILYRDHRFCDVTSPHVFYVYGRQELPHESSRVHSTRTDQNWTAVRELQCRRPHWNKALRTNRALTVLVSSSCNDVVTVTSERVVWRSVYTIQPAVGTQIDIVITIIIVSGDARKTSFLFQRLSMLIQRFNSALIMDSFCFSDEDPDLYSHQWYLFLGSSF